MNIKSKFFDSIVPGQLGSIQTNGDIAFALRRFKRMQKDAGTIVECYDRKFYTKPSVSKKKQRDSAKYIQSKQSR
jgi:ribosomal protein S21